MMNRKKTVKIVVLIIISLIIVILISIVALVGLMQITYQSLGFWTEVDFQNDSGERITITPIGIIEGRNEIGPIIMVRTDYFFEDGMNRNIPIGVNSTYRFEFDYDDQNLQFVLVNFGEETRILKIDEPFWENDSYQSCSYPPKNDTYKIPSRYEMPICPDFLLKANFGKTMNVDDSIRNSLIEI